MVLCVLAAQPVVVEGESDETGMESGYHRLRKQGEGNIGVSLTC